MIGKILYSRRRPARQPREAVVQGRKRAAPRLALEPLEDRCTPVANLQATGAVLVDFNGDPVAGLVRGEEYFVRAEWTTTDLTTTQQYSVRIAVDGVALEASGILGTPGVAVPVTRFLGNWFAAPGTHTVQVTVDPFNTIVESSEADNTVSINFTPAVPSTLPGRFVAPLGGTPLQDWYIASYVDTDPRTGSVSDFRGGGYSADGSLGHDYALAHFARMDAGVPVYAAASGVVTDLQDGAFDRQTVPAANPDNYVLIDHGNGWLTYYAHFAAHTLAVKVGDTVRAGQLLGLAGGAGDNAGPGLHFEVQHNTSIVEPNLDPASYWVTTPAYPGDAAPSVLDFGLTNADPAEDAFDRPSTVAVFPTTATSDVLFWLYTSHLRTTDVLQVSWYRPDGMLERSYLETTPTLVQGGYWDWPLEPAAWSLRPGTWQAAAAINGVEKARASFLVGAAGVPEIRVTQGTTYLLDERTTPIDFGSAALGGVAPTQTFTLQNQGSAALAVSGLVLPPGFTLVGTLPSSIAAGTSAAFTVRLDTAVAGVKFGQLRFTTNDADEASFNFNLTGTVTGAAPAGAPVVTLTDPALAYLFRQPPQVIAPLATVSDSDSANFNTGSLTVEFAAGGAADDRLAIRHQGTGAGQIGVSGGSVTHGGVVIGTFTGGSGGVALTVAFNASATVPAVQALLRNITFASGAVAPPTHPRSVRFTVRDNTARVSNQPIQTVVVAPTSTLIVNAVTPTTTGVTVQFSRPLLAAALNLHDVPGALLGPADVTLTGTATGLIRGSVVLDKTGTAFTFHRTDGALPADTYTLTLRSASNGFADTLGNLLDGNADGIPGDNHTAFFSVLPSAAVTVSVPDFMRGPGQVVDIPAAVPGLPLRLSTSTGVATVMLDLRWDPDLLSIADATAAPGVTASVLFTPGPSGSATVSFTSTPALPAGIVDFVRLTASVPTTASYTSKHLIDLSNVRVNGSAGRDDDGLHVVGYVGDTTGNAGYSTADAVRALRVAVGLDSGFSAYQLADPRLIADITANGILNAVDATRILQEAVGIDQPLIPPLPGVLPPIVPGGPDPLLRIPKDFRARPGDIITVPVDLDQSDGLEAVDIAISYDTSRLLPLAITDVQRGSLTGDFDLFVVNPGDRDGTLRVGLGRSAGPLHGRGSGSVLLLRFQVRADAPAGRAIINLRHSLGTTITQLNEGGLDLTPDPRDRAGDVLDGQILVERRTPRGTVTARAIDGFFRQIGERTTGWQDLVLALEGRRKVPQANTAERT